VTVYLVGAGPGDPGLLTRRGAELLGQADVVLYDRLVHPSLLALAPSSAELIDVGKHPGQGKGGEADLRAVGGAARQETVNQLLVHHARAGRTVVRLKGGDPFLFGRGGEEVEALVRAGVHCEVVPGVTSAFAVPAAAGIPVTHRGTASSVTVVTGRVGDPEAPGGVDWEALAQLDGTLVILMGMATRAAIAGALQAAGKPGDTPVAVIERGTTPAQAVVRTTLDHLGEVALGSPAVIVVGAVAALGIPPLAGRTVVVTRAEGRAGPFTGALQQAGAAVVEVALTEQVGPGDGGAALQAAAGALDSFDWVVFTSVNTVHRVMAAVRDARALGRCRVAAVGPATAAALRAAGVEPDLVPAVARAEGLLADFPEAQPGGGTGRVLYPAGEQAPPTIPEVLGARGWEVHRVDAYRTVAREAPDAVTAARMAAADAVVFAAGSAAEAYAALRDAAGGPLGVPGVVVCVGPSTAARARAVGMAGVVEAGDPSAAGVTAALVAVLDAAPEARSEAAPEARGEAPPAARDEAPPEARGGITAGGEGPAGVPPVGAP
jgi:uroporphyrinogen III methyltransferase/synthase